MDIPNDMDKSWDHPWSTEEIRGTRREWSLAGDVGLLNHLQQFSESLMSKMNKTQESLDKLTTQLNETAILIDNVTNTSLALADTQFIESLVQEDDTEVHKNSEEFQQNLKDQESAANVIASVSESVRRGLCIMEEKYKRMEVVDSDSDDEGDAIVLSVILGPNNPYQERSLPYIIGTEKWKASDKIGLESSSSESEQIDEQDVESESDKESQMLHQVNDSNNGLKCSVGGLSSSLSSSEMDNYNEQTNNMPYVNNGKLDNISQATMNSESESITPVKNSLKGMSDATPKFAAELAKRLDTVQQIQSPLPVDETREPSINRFKDDLFAPKKESEKKFTQEFDKWLSTDNDLFPDGSSSNFWNKQPQKSYAQNVIPPSIDIPPPISTISTKPKSAIDDLFGDGDSEDSDDIFSSKSTTKNITKENPSTSKSLASLMDAPRSYLDVVAPGIANNVTTSTPETNTNNTSLFSDKEENDNDLFGVSKKQVPDPRETKSLNDGGDVLGSTSSSNASKKLASGMLQRRPSSSSVTDAMANNDGGRHHGPSLEQDIGADSNERSSIIAEGRVPTIAVSTENSSGISTQPLSFNSTGGSSAGVDFTSPELTSTRLKSEEIYRERIVSDSLFGTRTPRNPRLESSAYGMPVGQPEEVCGEEPSSSNRLDDAFENEDVFGPPPLPKADSKIGKPKATSLFDESDSGDELFSTTSSGSRSQKSTDFFVTIPHNPEKNMLDAHRKAFFDDDIDIFGSKDSPDVNIFGIFSKQRPPAKTSYKEENIPQNIPEDRIGEQTFPKSSVQSKIRGASNILSKRSIFDDDDNIDDDDLFSTNSSKTEKKTDAGKFKVNDSGNLFSAERLMKDVAIEKPVKTHEQSKTIVKDDVISTNVTNVVDRQMDTKINSAQGSLGSELPSSSVEHHDFFSKDDDYDDLFDQKNVSTVEKSATANITTTSREEVRPEERLTRVKSVTIKDEETLPKPAPLPSSCKDDIADDFSSQKSKEVKNKELFEAQRESDGGNRRHPPNTLNIKASTSTSEESGQAPRRIVSGKIKDLMGKMGDLKILSPTDTPPLWKKGEEKMDEEFDSTDKDSDDGGNISVPKTNARPFTADENPASAQSVPSSRDGNVEVAISFDEPAQVETLSIAASKSRVKIRAKRRPQSRHARKSALRQSGIGFDTVDDVENDSQSDRVNYFDVSSKNNTVYQVTSSSALSSSVSNIDRLSTPSLLIAENDRIGEANLSVATEDKSELGSLSKESSMSANKNTLLSPSTDEEDLFDVPPDLPEDPQKEDTLFGRAPILSPVQSLFQEKAANIKPSKTSVVGENLTSAELPTNTKHDETDNDFTLGVTKPLSQHDERSHRLNDSVAEDRDSTDEKLLIKKVPVVEQERKSLDRKSTDGLRDPLRDNSHDPLKDPSQLFAFVTKTPSPEKGRSLLFPEDCSLFAGPKVESEPSKKQPLDLFTDDADGDLFSSTLVKPVKKPLRDTTLGLFDDDIQNDEDDGLFGSAAKTNITKTDSQKHLRVQESQKKVNLFEDDDDDFNLFVAAEKSQHMQKVDSKGVPEEKVRTNAESMSTSKSSEQFCKEENIFVAKKIVPKKTTASTSLFSLDADDESDEIFIKSAVSSSSAMESEQKTTEDKPVVVKKVVTRDLKKTAEKIIEDPLSLLQDD